MKKWLKGSIVGFTLLLFSLTSCSRNSSDEAVSTSAPEAVEESADSQAVEIKDSFGDAVNNAMAAAEAAQIAKNSDEWENVATLWAQSIELMKSVPESSENYQIAQQKVVEYQPNLEYAQHNTTVGDASPTKAASKQEQITVAGGLGDTRAVFDKKHGAGKDEENVHVRYRNDYLLVTFVEGQDFDFVDGRVQNVTIQFEATSSPLVSTAQAIQTAEGFLPKDAVKGEEQQANDDFYHIEYTSQSLANVISPGWFFDSNPGVFTVSLWQDWDDPSKVYAVSISTGGI